MLGSGIPDKCGYPVDDPGNITIGHGRKQGKTEAPGIIGLGVPAFPFGISVFFDVIGLPVDRNIMDLREDIFCLQCNINL